MEMIERVARAICMETGRMGDALPIEMQRVDRDWRDHIKSAQAAIEAMREPTENMLMAGMEAALKENSEYLDGISHNSHSWSAVHVALGNSKTASAVFQAMVTAALQEGKETGE
jgi:hypothetical protein